MCEDSLINRMSKPGCANWTMMGLVMASRMFPRPNSLTNGVKPGGTKRIGGRPYAASLALASSCFPALATVGRNVVTPATTAANQGKDCNWRWRGPVSRCCIDCGWWSLLLLSDDSLEQDGCRTENARNPSHPCNTSTMLTMHNKEYIFVGL